METVFARLAPLEARLAGIEQGVAQSLPRLAALEAEDPRAALVDLAADLGARMEALRDEQGAAAARIEALRERPWARRWRRFPSPRSPTS